MSNEPEDIRSQQVQHIQSLFAFNLFQKGNFDESLQLFFKLNTGSFRISSFKFHFFLFTIILYVFFFRSFLRYRALPRFIAS